MMVRRSVRLIAAVGVAVALAGCAATPITQSLTAAPPPDLPVMAELRDVPFFAQTEYFCGPAALATALKDSGVDTTPDGLAQAIYTPGRQGTLQTEILTGTRRHGRLAIPVAGMVNGIREVADGNPVLVLQNLSLEFMPQWHYAVLVGYDLKARTVVLRSGEIEREMIDMKTLEHTWRRAEFWGIVVAKPEGPVPQSASMVSWLEAALGLERVSRLDDALMAYRTAILKWPEATAPLIATANVLITQGVWADAESVLTHAYNLDQNDPIILNNLANVLLERKKCRQAETMAEAAVAAGGPFLAISNDTLATVRAAPACHQSI
ncbi:MAG: PA2778 family cysteine peptidase [Rhodospirillales bacterium]|nr:PA2778 family cysteine peptidase [Rhodospirillales bacterium]